MTTESIVPYDERRWDRAHIFNGDVYTYTLCHRAPVCLQRGTFNPSTWNDVRCEECARILRVRFEYDREAYCWTVQWRGAVPG
ncbi:MAG: hypothetical protein ACRDYA_16435 [Egibacteraceae bacterium]